MADADNTRATRPQTPPRSADTDLVGGQPAVAAARSPLGIPPSEAPILRRRPAAPGAAAPDVIADLWRQREEARRLPEAPPTPVPPKRAVPGPHAPYASRRTVIVGIVVAVAVNLGVGVGALLAGDVGGGGHPKPFSRAKFLSQAEAACATANGPAAAITRPTSYPELATAVGTIVTATTNEVQQLRRLPLPKGPDGTSATAFYTDLDATAQSGQTLQAAAAAKDDAATVKATAAFAGSFNIAAAQAKAVGFTNCGAGLQQAVDNVFGGSHAIVKASFVAKADSLCRATARELDALPEPRANDSRALIRFLDQGLVLVDKLMSDLTTLPLPPGDEQAVRDALAAQAKANAKLHEMRDAAVRGDFSTFTAAEHEYSPLTTAANAKFDAYGLGVCGSNFGEI